MILLDTSAVIWIEQQNPRVRSLTRGGRRLFLSPATLLELQFLSEVGRIRIGTGTITQLAQASRKTGRDYFKRR